MRQFTLIALAVAASVGICIVVAGPWIGGYLAVEQNGRPNTTSQLTAGAASGPSADEANDWLTRLNTIQWQDASREVLQSLMIAIKSSEMLREATLLRYRNESNLKTKAILRQVLASNASATPDLKATATTWAQDGDASVRADGFWLLAEIGPTNQTSALARHAIASESEPAPLVGALAALKPPGMPPPDEVPPVVARLQVLARHDAPLVRALSIQKLAEWDRSRQVVMAVILNALADQDAEVRRAAVVAVDIAALRSPDIKAHLLKLLGDEAEETQVREAVAWVLEPFALARDEYEVYQRGLRSVLRLDAHVTGPSQARVPSAQ